MKRRTDGLALAMALPLLAQTALALAESCEDAVKRLEERYTKTEDYCVGQNGERQSAQFCSGLTIRGVKRPEESGGKPGDYYVFGISPNAQEVGSSAATYARADIKFRDIVVMGGDNWQMFNSGIVVRSAWDTPNTADKVYIDCSFPADAWAYDRGDKGCGDNSKTPEHEGRCVDAGINGQNWSDKYFLPNLNQSEYIGGTSCAFDSRTENNIDSSNAFKDFLDARRAMEAVPNQTTAFNTYPEVRFSNPQSGITPVDVFYYTSADGREAALKNQAEYKQKTGLDVAVVQFDFPDAPDERLTFSCDAKPDPAPAPVPAPGTSPDKLAEGGWGTGDDPKQCSSYFKEVSWINRGDLYLGDRVNSVSVVPTDCGREIGPDQTDAAFAELKRKALALEGGAEKWKDRDQTLRRQFVCHLTLDADGEPVRYKHEYNLEPDRSYVSHEESLAQRCNPPQTDDGKVGGWGPNKSPQCTQYVQSVQWVARTFAEYPGEKIQSLKIVPTECGRKIGPDQTDKLMAEIKRKALAADPNGAKYWGNKDPSMRNQTICLMKHFRNNTDWNIESKRPNETPLAQVEAAQCNHK